MSKEFYYFYTRLNVNNRKNKKISIKKYNKYIPNYLNHCDLCNKDKKEYMYKSFIPNKIICRSCYKKLKRESNPNWCR